MNKKLVAFFYAALLLFPVIVLAIAFPKPPAKGSVGIGSIIPAINNIIGIIWVIFGGFAIIMFIYAGFLFVTSHGDPGKVKEARNAVLWGAVGVAVGLLSTFIPYIIARVIGL